MTFKVGDKVRTIPYQGYGVYEGDTGTVTGIDDDAIYYPVGVQFDCGQWLGCEVWHLELVSDD